jgi:hypothetical protein
MLMLPLQPRSNAATANRRWVRQDFRMRRKMFLEEVSDRPSETPSLLLRCRSEGPLVLRPLSLFSRGISS